MVVRDEADIVAESVAHNLRHLDAIAVTDNGSTDGTWEILLGLAAADGRVRLFRDLAPFTHRVFHRSALRVRDIGFSRRGGDWAIQCDCDELHESDVRAVCEASAGCDLILGRKWQFTLLPDTPAGGPARERLRWYHPVPQLEHRAYRNPRWFFVRDVARRFGLRESALRLDLAHYQYRSPAQVASRLAVRHEAARTHDLAWWRASPRGVSPGADGLVFRDRLDGWNPQANPAEQGGGPRPPMIDGKDNSADAPQADSLEFSGGRAVRALAPGEVIRLDSCGVCVLDGNVVVDFRYPGHPDKFGQVALGAGFWAEIPAGSEVRAKDGARLLVLPMGAE